MRDGRISEKGSYLDLLAWVWYLSIERGSVLWRAKREEKKFRSSRTSRFSLVLVSSCSANKDFSRFIAEHMKEEAKVHGMCVKIDICYWESMCEWVSECCLNYFHTWISSYKRASSSCPRLLSLLSCYSKSEEESTTDDDKKAGPALAAVSSPSFLSAKLSSPTTSLQSSKDKDTDKDKSKIIVKEGIGEVI